MGIFNTLQTAVMALFHYSLSVFPHKSHNPLHSLETGIPPSIIWPQELEFAVFFEYVSSCGGSCAFVPQT